MRIAGAAVLLLVSLKTTLGEQLRKRRVSFGSRDVGGRVPVAIRQRPVRAAVREQRRQWYRPQ